MLNVAWCMKKIRAAPPHSSAVSPPATGPARGAPRAKARGHPPPDPEDKRAADDPDPRVREQVPGVPRLVGDLHVGEHPADVGMGQPLQLTAPAAALPQMLAVRISG